AISEVTKVAAAGVYFRRRTIFRRPIIGQLNLSDVLLPRGCQEDERETALFAVFALHFFQTKQVEESNSCVRIADADHGVQIFDHGNYPFIAVTEPTPLA